MELDIIQMLLASCFECWSFPVDSGIFHIYDLISIVTLTASVMILDLYLNASCVLNSAYSLRKAKKSQVCSDIMPGCHRMPILVTSIQFMYIYGDIMKSTATVQFPDLCGADFTVDLNFNWKIKDSGSLFAMLFGKHVTIVITESID